MLILLDYYNLYQILNNYQPVYHFHHILTAGGVVAFCKKHKSNKSKLSAIVGIMATVWDFSTSLGFGISATNICRKPKYFDTGQLSFSTQV